MKAPLNINNRRFETNQRYRRHINDPIQSYIAFLAFWSWLANESSVISSFTDDRLLQPKAPVESKIFKHLNVQIDNDKIEMLMKDNENFATHHSYERVFWNLTTSHSPASSSSETQGHVLILASLMTFRLTKAANFALRDYSIESANYVSSYTVFTGILLIYHAVNNMVRMN